MSETSVLYKHTLRNALIPIITLMGFEFGTLLGGAVITEQVFNFPGLGTLFIASVVNRDYPVVMAICLLLGVAILIGNLLADRSEEHTYELQSRGHLVCRLLLA